MFSVIMPVFNAEKTLEDALQSLLNQDFFNFEVIVVDDCSTDSSFDIMNNYANRDKRVRVFSLPDNSGVAAARNFGINKAKNRYISFLDSDDLWLPHKLSTQLLHFKKGELVVFSSYIRFNECNVDKLVSAPDSVTYSELLLGNCIGNLTAAYDSHLLGKFFQEQIGHEDYLMWLTILKKANKAYGIQEPLARYRVSGSSLSGNKLKSASWVWNIYRNKLGISFFKSAYLFYHYVVNSFAKRL